ncbi:MAG: formylglycine-generating enzyme family protein, partial [bacterium]|nr:formylglycine-generating enzyme family protein [bacterium]
TEAEWERAARAGTDSAFWMGENLTTDQANYHGKLKLPEEQYREMTVPVRTFAKNPWNLYEVHGNVWEWVEDAAKLSAFGVVTDTYRDGLNDPLSSLGQGPFRLYRGGSWDYDMLSCRAAYRFAAPPENRVADLGFRLVRAAY